MEDEEWCAIDEKARSQGRYLVLFSQNSDPFEDEWPFYLYTLSDMY